MAELEPANSSSRRAEVLDLLRHAGEPLSIAEIADRLGVHVNTVRFHLGTLVANGQVERAAPQPGMPGRPAQLFRTVAGMDPMGPRHYRVLAEALTAGLASEPDPSGRAVTAGRAWGRQYAAGPASPKGDQTPDVDVAVDRLTELLDHLGFSPEQTSSDSDLQILLHHCPFLELARDHSAVICPVHLGLMRGALESWNAPVTVERLDAFARPNLCLVHLAAAAS